MSVVVYLHFFLFFCVCVCFRTHRGQTCGEGKYTKGSKRSLDTVIGSQRLRIEEVGREDKDTESESEEVLV